MSIYAKTNMDAMPGSCTECKCGDRYGCVGDVKCRILREYFTGNVEPPYKDRPDECPLVEQLEPPNSPLTLEELREMDGEPVWVVVSDLLRKNGFRDRWALVCVDRRSGKILLTNNAGASSIYEGPLDIEFKFIYRRKPEKGEEHGKQS